MRASNVVVVAVSIARVKSAFPTCARDMNIEVCGDKLNVLCIAVEKVLVIVSGMLSMKLATVLMV